jgi:hypothetical protein
MQFSNLIASSTFSNTKINEFNFSVELEDSFIIPKHINLLCASIPNTLLSFRSNELSIFVQNEEGTTEIQMVNGYYDTVQEFITMLNSVTATALSAQYVWSYSVPYEALKLSNLANDSFIVLPYSYSPNSCVKRLGFNNNVGYASFSENSYQVVYATGLLKLVRTTGFYICCNFISGNYTASPRNSNIITYVPIQLSNLKYGDSIVIENSQFNIDREQLTTSDSFNSLSNFFINILDDEMRTIDDVSKSDTILFFQLDYK